MRMLEKTLASPAQNLALDEALLDEAEAGCGGEVFRLWESDQLAVVLGRSSRPEHEVFQEACRDLRIPLFRRASGGAAVLIGPGCLMYAVVLSCRIRPQLRLIELAHQFVLTRMVDAIGSRVSALVRRGTSDLAVDALKVSGNSLRCKRDHVLYHGTILYDFDLALIETCLRRPPREPEYRDGRSHSQFVANLPLSGPALRQALCDGWPVDGPLDAWPHERTYSLARDRYERRRWIDDGRLGSQRVEQRG